MIRFYFLISFLYISFSACSESGSATNPEQYKDPDYVYNPNDQYVTISPATSDNFNYAEFGLYLPANREGIRAILIFVSGHNINAMYWKDNIAWRLYAEENNFALLGCYIVGNHSDKRYYFAENGSGESVIEALNQLAVQANFSAIRTLPLLIYGFSDGSIFSYTFTCYAASRVAGFVSIAGGYFPEEIINEGALKTPGLYFYGEYDTTRKNDMIYHVNHFRKEGAQWALIELKNTGHDIGASNTLALPYMEIVGDLRLDANSNNLSQIEIEAGYLASQTKGEYWSYNEYPFNADSASWLPNKEFSDIWKNFVNSQ